MHPIAKINAVLLLLCLGAGGGLARTAVSPEIAPPALPQPDAADLAPEPVRLTIAMPARQAVAGISARPLFADTRRPVRPKPATDPGRARPSAPPKLTLTGIAVLGQQMIATVLMPGGTSRNLEIGETVEGWRVARIGSDEIALERDAQRHVVPRKRAERPSAAAARVPAAAQAVSSAAGAKGPAIRAGAVRRPTLPRSQAARRPERATEIADRTALSAQD